jgi:DNA-binding response OmpR family regulator
MLTVLYRLRIISFRVHIHHLRIKYALRKVKALFMTEDNTTDVQVVIVEDQESLAEIYKTRLELQGFKCVVANDGIQAIVEIEKYRPRLVLLDLMLPKLSGEQILKVMRTSEWGEDIKVVIISNLNEADAPAGLRDLGITDYLVKANMTDDQVDKLVSAILRPVGQTGDSSLEGQQDGAAAS